MGQLENQGKMHMAGYDEIIYSVIAADQVHSRNLIQLLPFQIGFGHFLQQQLCSC